MLRSAVLLLLIFTGVRVVSQKVEIISIQRNNSFRGLSVVSDNVLWVSGNEGTVGKSTDAGATWKWIQVPGYEKTDFRDIEAFDENTAVIMGIDQPAFILRTTDGGKTWEKVFEDNTPGIFLDAMDFRNEKEGIVIGDPLDNRFFMAVTSDGGKTWDNVGDSNRPLADSGEACFASSGTNIRLFGKNNTVFISGGQSSNFFLQGKSMPLPLIQGSGSTGANSVAVKEPNTFIIVGGDFTKKNDTLKNCALSYDGGVTWSQPIITPHGYRSCVEFLTDNDWITCGLNGVDFSSDNGRTWNNISTNSFHVVRKAKKGTAVFLVGNSGKLGKLAFFTSKNEYPR